MKSNLKNSIIKCSRPRWPFPRHSTAWLPTLTLCLLGGLLSASAQVCPSDQTLVDPAATTNAQLFYRAMRVP